MGYNNNEGFLSKETKVFCLKAALITLFFIVILMVSALFVEASDYEPLPWNDPNYISWLDAHNEYDINSCVVCHPEYWDDLQEAIESLEQMNAELRDIDRNTEKGGCFITASKATMYNDPFGWDRYDAPTLNPWDMTVRRTGSIFGWYNFYIWGLSFLTS